MNRKLLVITLALALITLFSIVSLAQEHSEFTANQYTVGVNTHPATGEVRAVPDASATLLTNEDGAWFHMRTSEFEEGHVYTVWWVIMNNPEACAESACVGPDVFGNPDGVQAELTLADTFLMDETANISLSGYLPTGDVDNPWYGNGFTNPTGAQIWIVVNHHGPLIADQAGNMLNTYRGGCTDESANSGPFPDAGIADGEAGPNTCLLYQIASFTQSTD